MFLSFNVDIGMLDRKLEAGELKDPHASVSAVDDASQHDATPNLEEDIDFIAAALANQERAHGLESSDPVGSGSSARHRWRVVARREAVGGSIS